RLVGALHYIGDISGNGTEHPTLKVQMQQSPEGRQTAADVIVQHQSIEISQIISRWKHYQCISHTPPYHIRAQVEIQRSCPEVIDLPGLQCCELRVQSSCPIRKLFFGFFILLKLQLPEVFEIPIKELIERAFHSNGK